MKQFINIGDIVCLPGEKYSASCYGFVIRIEEEFIVVQWFDGIKTEEDLPNMLMKVDKDNK